MSDGDRALAGRRTPPRGVPVHVDEELTPPPQEPPKPSEIAGYETLPPPVRRQFDMVADALGNVTTAIGKLWDTRQDSKRLDTIDAKLATLATAATRSETTLEQFLGPAIKQLMSAVNELDRQMPRLSQQLETTSTLLTVVDERLRKLEGDLRIMSAEFDNARKTSAERHAEHSKRLSDLDGRVDAIERKERDREVVTKALARSERRKSGVVGAAVAAIVSAAAAVIKHFT